MPTYKYKKQKTNKTKNMKVHLVIKNINKQAYPGEKQTTEIIFKIDSLNLYLQGYINMLFLLFSFQWGDGWAQKGA